MPTSLADRLDDLADEAGAVLERAAVVVLAIVDRRAEELRDQVAVGAVQLDAVERRPRARAARPAANACDDVLDLRERHPLALEAVQRIVLVGRAQALGVFDARDVALPAAVAQLQDVLAVVRRAPA